MQLILGPQAGNQTLILAQSFQLGQGRQRLQTHGVLQIEANLLYGLRNQILARRSLGGRLLNFCFGNSGFFGDRTFPFIREVNLTLIRDRLLLRSHGGLCWYFEFSGLFR